jgi:hypothetical protein
VDPDEAMESEYFEAIETDHDFQECRDKFLRMSFCHGSTCVYYPGGIRLQVDCPCECHKEEL